MRLEQAGDLGRAAAAAACEARRGEQQGGPGPTTTAAVIGLPGDGAGNEAPAFVPFGDTE